MTVGCYRVGGWASKVPRENDLAAKPVREPLQIECESTSRARRDGESERRRDAGKTSRATYISIPLVPAKAGTQTPVKHPEPRTFQFRSSPPKRGPRRRMIEWIPAYTGMSG